MLMERCSYIPNENGKNLAEAGLPDSADGDNAAIDRYAWIPQEILRAVSLPDRELV